MGNSVLNLKTGAIQWSEHEIEQHCLPQHIFVKILRGLFCSYIHDVIQAMKRNYIGVNQ